MNQQITKIIKTVLVSVALISINTIFANNAVVKKNEAIEYCQQVRSGEINGNQELQKRAIEQGWICNEDLVTNLIYSAFGENEGTDNLKKRGFEAYDEVKIKHEQNKPFWDTIYVFIQKTSIFVASLAVGWFLLIHVLLKLGSGKEVNVPASTMYTLTTGLLGFKGIAIIFFIVSVAIILANRLAMYFAYEIETSDYNQVISDNNIVAMEIENANEFLAMSLQADRTERINKSSFNTLFSDNKNKSWHSFLNHTITKQGARDRVITETPSTFAVSVDNKLYIEFFRFSASMRKFIDKIVLIKNDVERKYSYEEDWYGFEGTYGSLSVENNIKDLKGTFATGDVKNQSEIQEASEQALLNLSRVLANDSQLEIVYRQIRKDVEAKVNSSGRQTIELSDINSSMIEYIKGQMKPSFTQAMSTANVEDSQKRKIYAQMIAGQMVSMMQGASYSVLNIDTEMGSVAYSQPRFLDLKRVFVQPFIDQINLYNCSGVKNYRQYVAPYKSKVELYNSLPEKLSQEEVLSSTNYINTACVNINENGLELIGSFDESDKEEAFKNAHIERLTLAIYLAAIKKAGILLAEEEMSKDTEWLNKIQLHGFLGLYIHLKDILSADDTLNFGKEYLINTVTYAANVDYGIENFFINSDILDIPDRTSMLQKLQNDFQRIDLSSIFRAGTVLQPSINSNLNSNESSFSGSFINMNDIIEYLLLIDLTPMKQMACVDINKSFADGIEEKRDDRIAYEQGNYKCIDLMTGTAILGGNMIERGILIKVSKAAIDGIIAGMDAADDFVGTKNGQAAKVSKLIPWKLVGKSILMSLSLLLIPYDTLATLMIIAGVMFQYLIPLSIAIAGISALIAYISLIFRTMITLVYEMLISSIKGDNTEEKAYKALIAAYPQTTKNFIALLLTPVILVLGIMLFVIVMNSIGSEILVAIIESLFATQASNILVQALFQVMAIIIFLILTWIVIQILINEFIKKFPEAILSIFNVNFRFEAQIDKAVEQLIAGGMVATTVKGVADVAKAGTSETTRKINALRNNAKKYNYDTSINQFQLKDQ